MKCSYPGTCTNAVSTIYHASSCCVNSQDSCHFCCCKRTVVKYTYEYVRKGRCYTCHIHNSKVHVRTKTGDGYPYCYCCCEFRQPIASCLQGGLAAYTSMSRGRRSDTDTGDTLATSHYFGSQRGDRRTREGLPGCCCRSKQFPGTWYITLWPEIYT